MESFGQIIRSSRKKKGLALRKLAANIDLDPSSLSKVERDEMIAPERIIKPLAHELNLSFKELQILYLSQKLYNELKDKEFAQESLELVIEKMIGLQGKKRKEKYRESIIQKIIDYLSQKPISKIWVFGSFARNELHNDSDIDILVKFQTPHDIDLFEYAGMKQDLEDLIGRSIDLVEEDQLLENVRPYCT